MNAVRAYYLAGRRLRVAVRDAQAALANGGRRPVAFGDVALHIHLAEVDRWVEARKAIEAQVARAFPAPVRGAAL